ncbi:hypothetical protein P7228_09705 [Altererythrobacter arenosus]|uniref:DUF697 domain-containing protein n=1 Tax=Altererythrobacter arenosus TaxID=3032592 RepID=A0ABY8FMM0_9SPHN|nr:hypothetical protein [Altererythrobacter sp. CAU 1644]WFL76272.1 hypothetical protein P7228_09705 [Altererythrobacter sp. CAU 1644]
MAKKPIGEKVSDQAAEAAKPLARVVKQQTGGMPGPSTNPATNILIADIVLRGAGRIMRNSMQKGMLRAGYDRETAREMINNRTMASSLILYGASKIATRSIPGALLVGGGLIAKTLYDRGLSKREARRRGEKQIEQMTEKK